MSLAKIRDEHRVPTRLGAPVYVEPLDIRGTITGTFDHFGRDYVEVTADNDGFIINVHPQDLTYLKGTPQ